MTPNDLNLILTRLNISKTDLSIIVGVTPRQVNSWSRGVHAIPRSVAVLLGAIDNKKISLDWVVSFVEAELRRESGVL